MPTSLTLYECVRYNVHMINTLSLTEARRTFFEIAQSVQAPNTHFILTEHGKPKVALLSADEFESILETLEVLKDFPELEKDHKTAMEEFKSGTFWILQDSSKGTLKK